MRAVIQRVERAVVRAGGRVTGEIGVGLLVLAGFGGGDSDETLDWVARKLVGLRIFPDEEGRMNRSIADVEGEVLVVSQFTLYGDVSRGRRPSFVEAASPGDAAQMYEHFLERVAATGVPVAQGEFGATMDVESVNSGPVTILIER